ncbi:UDP-glucose 4-epimerase [Limihaloglobus sulfuriphilus]|uniref:UDP-glucose 4-epimerase n=1 Tax=Limihaloglobus sulfuriphilus TaxID=1851148 RepID=A0A1Q2MDP6_9BACT|nr:SDR family oxidoreductase [Limihaloglobus sulfuriphilus]AQQ70826.1 UDP-glucose 4-epimerase [Limihaloglobus sulfuriphilus]
MKVLITGGAGFIGSHIAQQLQGRAQVRILDNLRSGFKHNIEPFDVEFIEGSITDKKIVREAVDGVDYIFQLAAMISVPESMANPAECVEINVNGILNVLQAAADAGVKKLVHSSSAAIYGDNPVVPKLESMYPEPKSPYGITKLDGEYYCRMFAEEGLLNTACLRYFNVFGPRQDPNSQYAAAVPIFIYRALRNEPIMIFGDGEQTRDFVFVEDVARANIFMATNPEFKEVYNVAYGKTTTIKSLAQSIIRFTGSSSEIVFKEERPGDVKHSTACIDKLLGCGFSPSGSFEAGLQKTIEFFK